MTRSFDSDGVTLTTIVACYSIVFSKNVDVSESIERKVAKAWIIRIKGTKRTERNKRTKRNKRTSADRLMLL